MRTPYRDYVLGRMRMTGMSVDELCTLADISVPTLYRRLDEPEKMNRELIRVLHKYCDIPYEELVERC